MKGREMWLIDPATDIALSTRAKSAKEDTLDQGGINAQLQTLGEWCLKRAREQHNPSTTRSMLRRKVDQILSPRPGARGGL